MSKGLLERIRQMKRLVLLIAIITSGCSLGAGVQHGTESIALPPAPTRIQIQETTRWCRDRSRSHPNNVAHHHTFR